MLVAATPHVWRENWELAELRGCEFESSGVGGWVKSSFVGGRQDWLQLSAERLPGPRGAEVRSYNKKELKTLGREPTWRERPVTGSVLVPPLPTSSAPLLGCLSAPLLQRPSFFSSSAFRHPMTSCSGQRVESSRQQHSIVVRSILCCADRNEQRSCQSLKPILSSSFSPKLGRLLDDQVTLPQWPRSSEVLGTSGPPGKDARSHAAWCENLEPRKQLSTFRELVSLPRVPDD